MARLRRLARPESYVSAKSAAAVLRKMADEIEQRDDGQLVSLSIERKYASKADIEHSLQPPIKRLERIG